MQTLKLADDLFSGLKDGSKKGTVRFGKRDVEIGPLTLKSVNGTEPDVTVEVTRVSYTRARDLRQADAEMDGCDSPGALREVLLRFYPQMTGDSVLTVIHFG